MATYRQAISDIRGFNKLLSADALINDRVILSDVKTNTFVLIKQQTDKRKLFQSVNIFTPLPCLEMVEVPIGECCEFTSPIIVAKSKEEIPKIAEGIFGLLVQRVYGADTLISFNPTTANRYANLLKLNLPNTDHFYWIFDKHLYVSNGDTKAVSMLAYFEEDVPNKLLCPQDCDCKPKPKCDPCLNPLDGEWKCPGYLQTTVKEMVAKHLLQTYFGLKSDKTSDNKDDTSQ